MGSKLAMPTKDQALPGRAARMPVPAKHYVNGNLLEPPFPAGLEVAMFGLGCFWGAEKRVWAIRDAYQRELTRAGHGRITTEIAEAPEFYYAEDYHQQYLAKKPWGYCGLGGTGVACPSGIGEAAR